MRKLKHHPDSPIQASDLKIDSTRRHYVVEGTSAFRVKSKVIQVKPRVFRIWCEREKFSFAPAGLVL